jgi:hypothetical protein
MILSKPRKSIIEGINQSLDLLRSEIGIESIIAEINNEHKREIEISINRAFYFCLRDIFLPQYNIVPIQEAPIQPREGMSFTTAERKKPDFSLILNDDLNKGIAFHIECKRLESSTKYNKKYVKEGIYRFTTEEDCYGIDYSSGVMVGYIEDMELEDILMQVNQAIDHQLKIDNLIKTTDWQEKSTTHLNHSFNRSFKESEFTLHHLWVDLRGCYPRS